MSQATQYQYKRNKNKKDFFYGSIIDMNRPNGNSPKMENVPVAPPEAAAPAPIRNPFNVSNMFAALPALGPNRNRNKTRKNKLPKRKDPKRRNMTVKNIQKRRANEAARIRAERRRQRVAEKRVKSLRIKESGIEGIKELMRKLEKLEKFYDAANDKKQNDIMVYTAILTTELQSAFNEEYYSKLYKEDYPEVFNAELAADDPLEYISELLDLFEEMVDQYEDTNDDAKQIEMDIYADEILKAAAKAGKAFNSISEERNNAAINALANIFGQGMKI